MSAREKYWRALAGVDVVTKEDLRVRKHRALVEERAEDAAWAAFLTSTLTSDLASNLPSGDWYLKAEREVMKLRKQHLAARGRRPGKK